MSDTADIWWESEKITVDFARIYNGDGRISMVLRRKNGEVIADLDFKKKEGDVTLYENKDGTFTISIGDGRISMVSRRKNGEVIVDLDFKKK